MDTAVKFERDKAMAAKILEPCLQSLSHKSPRLTAGIPEERSSEGFLLSPHFGAVTANTCRWLWKGLSYIRSANYAMAFNFLSNFKQ